LVNIVKLKHFIIHITAFKNVTSISVPNRDVYL